jgi:hypothetical protein
LENLRVDLNNIEDQKNKIEEKDLNFVLKEKLDINNQKKGKDQTLIIN